MTEVKVLTLHLKRKHWEDIRDGRKPREYRLVTDYWMARLHNRHFHYIALKLGYPKTGDDSRVLLREWHGMRFENITHEEFGPDEVTVFSIDVRNPLVIP